MKIRGWEGDDDLQAAIRCYNRSWRVGFRGLVPEETIEAMLRADDQAAIDELEDRVDAPSTLLIVAEVDGDVVGYLLSRYARTATFVDTADAEIVELYVDPAHWREGVATELMATLETWLPAQIQGIVVEVLGENERAQSFFESQGFDLRDTGVKDLDGTLFGSGVYRRDLD